MLVIFEKDDLKLEAEYGQSCRLVIDRIAVWLNHQIAWDICKLINDSLYHTEPQVYTIKGRSYTFVITIDCELIERVPRPDRGDYRVVRLSQVVPKSKLKVEAVMQLSVLDLTELRDVMVKFFNV